MSIQKFRLRKLTPIEKLIKARVILLKERPFFGTLVLHLRFVEADNEFLKKMIPTMGIDKWGRLFFSPDFVDSLSLEELLSVMCHEVHHAVLLHLDRKMSRDERTWNYAADFVINEILKQNGFQLGDGWLIDPKYESWYAEEIYEDLRKQQQKVLDQMQEGQFDVHVYIDVDNQGKPAQKEGDGQCPDTDKGTGSCGFTGDEDKEIPQWDKVLKEAYQYAKQQGKAPLGMERIIEGLTKSQVPWQSIVRKYIVATMPKDYTYFRPHKRSQQAGYYMPNIKREEIDICVGIDTSGSVSDAEYMEFISELVGLNNTFKGRIKFHIVTCDAAIHTVDDFAQGFDPRKLRARGYGGTLFKPVFEHIKEHKRKAKLLIYFTDLYGDQDHLEASRYQFHTLWVLTENSNENDPPFGSWVRLVSKGEKNGRAFNRPF